MESQEVPQSTYADRLKENQDKARKAAFEKRSQEPPQVKLTDQEKAFALKTIHLLNDEGFKAFMDFYNHIIAQRLATAFDPPPLGLYATIHEKFGVVHSMTTGEQMAFKKGDMYGVQYLKHSCERIWRTLLAEQEQLSKKKEK